MMALGFGLKAVTGYFLGVLTLRYGARASTAMTVLLLLAAGLWGMFVPGYFYLMAFGLSGGGELGGAYFNNYIVAVSHADVSARNLGILALAIPASAFTPALLGWLADSFGYSYSFALGAFAALISLLMVLALPRMSTGDEHVEKDRDFRK